MCGPDLAVACCVDVDGVGYALELAVIRGMVGLALVGEGFEAIGQEGTALFVEDVSLDQARPEIFYPCCV